jgi:hypothetical protein
MDARYRVLRNRDFFAAALALVGLEAGFFRWTAQPFELWAPVVAVSAYVPLAFLFHCNVCRIGTRHELVWAAGFLLLAAGSWLAWGRLRLEIVIAGGVAMTAFFCWRARRRP